MPTHLPVRAPAKAEPGNVAAYIAGALALAVLVGLTLRAPVPCDIDVDGESPDSGVPPRLVRIVMAHSAPVAAVRGAR